VRRAKRKLTWKQTPFQQPNRLLKLPLLRPKLKRKPLQPSRSVHRARKRLTLLHLTQRLPKRSVPKRLWQSLPNRKLLQRHRGAVGGSALSVNNRR
jgi:hypothetical protein